jgi:hypothetical protein
MTLDLNKSRTSKDGLAACQRVSTMASLYAEISVTRFSRFNPSTRDPPYQGYYLANRSPPTQYPYSTPLYLAHLAWRDKARHLLA